MTEDEKATLDTLAVLQVCTTFLLGVIEEGDHGLEARSVPLWDGDGQVLRHRYGYGSADGDVTAYGTGKGSGSGAGSGDHGVGLGTGSASGSGYGGWWIDSKRL